MKILSRPARSWIRLSLRAQLLVVLAVILVPVAALTVYAGLDRRAHEGERTRERAVTLAREIGRGQAEAIEAAHQVMAPLASLLGTAPGFADVPEDMCQRLFAPYVGEGARYRSAMVTAADGEVLCGSLAAPDLVTDAQRDVATLAARDRRPVVGEVFTPGDGNPVLPVAHPIVGSAPENSGQTTGILVFNLGLSALSFSDVERLPPGSFVTLYDNDGTILARHPESDGIIGRRLAGRALEQLLATRSGTLEATSIEDEPSLVGYTALDDAGSVFVAVGIPKSFAFAEADSALERSLMLLAFVTGGSFLLAVFGSERIVLRPVARTVRAAQRMEAGERGVRIGPDYGPGEIGDLGRSFDRMAAAIEAQDAALRDLNADLERRVEERTAQLQEANKDLESFSYSVSHDLRAPLRSVEGFSDILQTKYGHELPEEAERFLSRIRFSTRRMGSLIDDLFQFSRVARAELERRMTSLDALVEETIEDLRTVNPQRNIEWQLGHLGTAEVDPGLTRRLFANLMGNAVKFSRDSDPATISIGCDNNGDERVYYVKDNGVGFDSDQAATMFGVFQRLHLHDDFEGTGVGLAIVDRIVRRHGGRIWAEASPGEGAAFYFTLGQARPVDGGMRLM